MLKCAVFCDDPTSLEKKLNEFLSTISDSHKFKIESITQSQLNADEVLLTVVYHDARPFAGAIPPPDLSQMGIQNII